MSYRILSFVFLSLLGALSVRAQVPSPITFELGPRVGYDIGGDVEKTFVGADARLGIMALPIDFQATFDYYFMEENTTFWQLSLNALLSFGPGVLFTPYVGGGIGISRTSGSIDIPGFDDFGASDTDTGLNLVGGVRFGVGPLRPFVQAQVTMLGDVELVTVAGGLLFKFGP
jgi:opacity protein-like surface antigen